MSAVFDVIYLGNFATDLDPIEGDASGPLANDVAEARDTLLGEVFGSAANPLADNVSEWTSSNPIGGFPGSPASAYDIDDNVQGISPDGPFSPGGNQAFTTQGSDIFDPLVVDVFDSWVNVGATITYTDGSTASTFGDNELTIVQSADGDLFLLPFTPTSGPSPLLSAGPIQSIEITSVSNSVFGGLRATAFSGSTSPFVCFTRGTGILTPSGEVPVEELQAGDLVQTLDHGMQPIRWIGSAKRPATGKLAPVLIAKGTLGNHRDLKVSQQHRMFLTGSLAELLFGELEVLASAKSLVNDTTIRVVEGGTVEYFHILFDTHQIIHADGALSESFHPGEQGWSALDSAMKEEIQALFPQILDRGPEGYGSTARLALKGSEATLWAKHQHVSGQLN